MKSNISAEPAGIRLPPDPNSLREAIRKGSANLAEKQGDDGSWSGEYGGPMFLLPLYVAAAHVMGRELPEPLRQGITAYFRSVQNPDGSIGLHTEAPGSTFCTTLSYVSLRLLGVSDEDPDAVRMRGWIHENGSPLASASWGKAVLAVLNLYSYDGVQPVPPELWLLPRFLPFHPSRLWCHVRAAYLPLSYLYSERAACPESALILSLRSELYTQRYQEIDFTGSLETLAPCDSYVPPSRLLRIANCILRAYSRHPLGALRRRALDWVVDQINYEDRTTGLINIGPVSAALNTIVHHFRQPGGEAARAHFDEMETYLYRSGEFVLMNGEDSTALWDTAFSVQALLATPFGEKHIAPLRRAYDFLSASQIREDPPDAARYYRHPSRGAWAFSSRRQGWAVTDCTAEAIKSCLLLEPFVENPFSEDRLAEGGRWILTSQNHDGGWATYERQRRPAWLELFNPSQVFDRIMVDYSYTECSSACMQALAAIRGRFGHRFDGKIKRALRRGAKFLLHQQRADGSWEGSWGVCFTIGCWYGIKGLIAAGSDPGAPEIQRAADFLFRHQNPDGGWGESFESNLQRRYVPAMPSRAVNTAWALMSLVAAGCAGSEAAKRAARYLTGLQLSDGDWPREPMAGIFNRTTLIHYDNYRRYFPLRALGEYAASTARPPTE